MRVNHKFKSIPYVSDNVPPEVLKYREIHNSLIHLTFILHLLYDGHCVRFWSHKKE